MTVTVNAALERIQLWANNLDPADPLAIDLEEVIDLALIGLAVQPLCELYEADHMDGFTISRNEMGILLGYHPKPQVKP